MKRIAVALVIALLLSISTLAQPAPNAATVQRGFGRLLSMPGATSATYFSSVC